MIYYCHYGGLRRALLRLCPGLGRQHSCSASGGWSSALRKPGAAVRLNGQDSAGGLGSHMSYAEGVELYVILVDTSRDLRTFAPLIFTTRWTPIPSFVGSASTHATAAWLIWCGNFSFDSPGSCLSVFRRRRGRSRRRLGHGSHIFPFISYSLALAAV